MSDDRGDLKHSGKTYPRKDHRAQSRSAYNYNKIDKCRGLRRIADRHSHHRRRKINREELLRHGKEAIPLGSTTCTQKRAGEYSSMPQNLSNRKGSAQNKLGKVIGSGKKSCQFTYGPRKYKW